MDEVAAGMYGRFAAELGKAMGELGFDVSDVVVGGALSDEVTARVQGYPDGSALVSVANGSMTLGILYGRHTAQRLSILTRASRLGRVVSVVRMFVTDDSGLD